jgi:ribosomal protein S18 acetylase RimI-like enzyme
MMTMTRQRTPALGPSIPGLTFRPATEADTDRICAIMHGRPGDEAVGLCFGSADLARRLGEMQVRLPNSPSGWQHTVLAQINGEPVGVLQAGPGGNSFAGYVSLGLLLRAVRIFGPVQFIKGLPRLRARARVDTVDPEGAYVVHEIHVDPRHRNWGIGGAKLLYAEREARRLGHTKMSLTTTTTNPARHLYERHGYRIADTRTDPAYERYTGIVGRYLMVKELS